jgi:hypothetical protein
MTRDEVELKIREALATETSAIRLSNAIFAPTGLFAQLAANDAERRALVDSELFQEALDRFMDLQELEADEFAQTAPHFPAMPRIEPTSSKVA